MHGLISITRLKHNTLRAMVSTAFIAQSSFYCFSDSPKLISPKTSAKQSHALFLNGHRSFTLGCSNRVSCLSDVRLKKRRFRSVCFFNAGDKSKGRFEEEVVINKLEKHLLFYRAFEKLTRKVE